MEEELEIPREVLAQIRELSDRDLVRLIKEVSEYGWTKAEVTLRILVKEDER